MPRARKKPKPINHPAWQDFVSWVTEKHGGMHDHWKIQWDAYCAGRLCGVVIGLKVTCKAFIEEMRK